MTTVRIEDIRALRYCMPGARRFFTRHKLDWHSFVSEGIDADKLPKDDAMVEAAVGVAVKREAHEVDHGKG